MSKPKTYSSMIFLLIGVVIGGLAFSNFYKGPEARAFNVSEPAVTATVPPARDKVITSLRDLNNAFVDIAAAVSPTVVTVSTEKVLRFRNRSPFASPFFFDPFGDFFGDGNRRRGQDSPEQQFRQQGLGSGVIVSNDGYILTNNHVIAEADSITIRMTDGRTLPAKVIGTDPKTDIAVIRVNAKNLPAIRLGDSEQLRVGEWVLAIGSPLSADLASTVTQGIVSAKGRSNVGLAQYEDFIQTDAAINPGNSGGALINLDGELVGINTAIATRSGGFQGIGFSVPINMARHVMESLIKNGKVVRGWLGVSIQTVDESLAKGLNLDGPGGVVVSQVVENSPAEKAGLQAEDVILAMNGRKVKDNSQLSADIAAMAPGSQANLTVLREGRKREIAVTLGEQPANFGVRGFEPSPDELLGFTVETLNNRLAQRYDLDATRRGVVVTNIDAVSSAYRAGLREGDLIVKVNRKSVANVTEFSGMLQNAKKGDTVLLQIARNDGTQFLAFEL